MTHVSADASDSLCVWLKTHHETLSLIRQDVEALGTRTEESLWETIAFHFSTDWRIQHQRLQRKMDEVREMQSPEKRPLGLIGAALEGEKTMHIQTKHCLALANFTIVDENLRQDKNLQTLLALLVAQYRVNNILLQPLPQEEPQKPLMDIFKRYAKRIMSGNSEAKPNAGSVPSLKEI